MNTALHLQSPKTGQKSFFLIIEIRNNLNNQMHYKKRFSKTKILNLKNLLIMLTVKSQHLSFYITISTFFYLSCHKFPKFKT